MIRHPIAAMRHDHEAHRKGVKALASLTHSFTPPHDACGSWRRLYAGLAQFAADLEHHMHLEDDILVPVANAEQLRTALSVIDVVTFPDAGHGVVSQHPDAVTGRIRSFLRA